MWFYTKNITIVLKRIADALEAIRFIQNTPGHLSTVITAERKVTNMSIISFNIVLPPVVDSDVVARELVIQIDGVEPEIVDLGITETEVGREGPQDAELRLELTNIDDAGNRSMPSILVAVLADTFSPAQPGELSIVATGERNEPEPEPEPEPEQ